MIRNLEDLQTPALLIHLDRTRHNIARTLESVRGDATRWRPHVKTTKIPEVFDLLLEAGVRNFKCATTKEARALLDRAQQPIDLLVAMAHRGPNLHAVAALADRLPQHRVSLLSEDPEHAAEVRAASDRLGIFVDLDPGYGRSGIPLSDRARIGATVGAIGDALRGFHDYDGHLHGTDPRERRAAAEAVYDALIELVTGLGDRLSPSAEGLELITSGTPTFEFAARFGGFDAFDHKVSPGTVVYWDTTSQALGIEGYRYAATVLARVISSPSAGRVTLDAGSKALDAASGDPCCEVDGWPDLRAQRPSEEHLPLRALSGPTPSTGSLLQLIPRHVCPTVNLADQAVLVDDDRIVDIVPVAARGHDTAPSSWS